MSFPHNAAPPTQGFTLLPDGFYDLQITDVKEKKTGKGYPMVSVTCEVINSLDFNGKTIFHNVSFLPDNAPGAGMSTHFLKTIGQPWEGAIIVDPDNWIGERFRAKIGSREYDKKDGTKATTNDIKDVIELPEGNEFKNLDIGVFKADVQKADKDDTTPF